MKIEQCDREAAASLVIFDGVRANILAGLCDDRPPVQAFARHRIAERAAIVEFLRKVPPDQFDEATIDDIIAGAHTGHL